MSLLPWLVSLFIMSSSTFLCEGSIMPSWAHVWDRLNTSCFFSGVCLS